MKTDRRGSQRQDRIPIVPWDGLEVRFGILRQTGAGRSCDASSYRARIAPRERLPRGRQLDLGGVIFGATWILPLADRPALQDFVPVAVSFSICPFLIETILSVSWAI